MKKRKQEPKPCDYCSGEGTVDKNGNTVSSGDAYGEMFPCPNCKGSGKASPIQLRQHGGNQID